MWPWLDHRVLVDREPIVGVRVVEVDQSGDIAGDASVLAGDLDRHALDQVAVQPAVLFDERGRFGLLDLAQHFVERLGGEVWVEALECFAQAGGQQDLGMAHALRRGAVRGDIRPVPHRVAQRGKPFEGSVLDDRLRKRTHAPETAGGLTARRIIRRPPCVGTTGKSLVVANSSSSPPGKIVLQMKTGTKRFYGHRLR